MDNDIVSMSSGQGSSIVKRYGIADALSELMESAVMADTNAAQKAYDMIRMHAYGLTPASVGMKEGGAGSSAYGSGSQAQRAINSINQHRVSMNMEAEPNNIDDQTALENYEKENVGKLAMAQFTMRDASGAMQEVSIPKITMMPLPSAAENIVDSFLRQHEFRCGSSFFLNETDLFPLSWQRLLFRREPLVHKHHTVDRGGNIPPGQKHFALS